MEEFNRENVSVTNNSESPYLGVEITYSDAETAYRINSEMIRILPLILQDFNISANVAVISYPIVPSMPNLPSTPVLAAVGAGSGLLLGFLFVLRRELLDGTVRTARALKRVLDLKALCYLPKSYRWASGRAAETDRCRLRPRRQI
jgi:capsular polysaccharide biosynthesis protein